MMVTETRATAAETKSTEAAATTKVDAESDQPGRRSCWDEERTMLLRIDGDEEVS